MSLKKIVNWMLLWMLLIVVLSGCTPFDQITSTEELKDSRLLGISALYYFATMLDSFADWFGGSYGLSILLLTIIVRTAILPLTLKQYRSTKAMQALQPEMNKIKDKYKDNPQKQQEETMKLFQQYQANPLAGCLPLIVQMPIFIALYNAIYMNPNIRSHTFLWLELGAKDPYYVLPIIAAITTFIQSKMMPQQPNNSMQSILLIFPVLIFVMAINFPAALPLYWIYSNIYTIVQNYFLHVRNTHVQDAHNMN